MVKNAISVIAILGMIAIRYIEITHQAETNLYFTVLLGGIAIGIQSEDFIKIIDYLRGKK